MNKNLLFLFMPCLIVSTSTEIAYGMKRGVAATEETAIRKDFGIRERASYFQDFIGIPESSLNPELIRDKVIVEPDPAGIPNFKIRGVDGVGKPVIYQCGFLEQISLGQLRNTAREKAQIFPHNKPIKFSVIEAESFGTSAPVDIGALQAAPANKDAVFQVASNFNALETTSPRDKSNVNSIQNYWADNTQGPRASISAVPGLFYRRYYYFLPVIGYDSDARSWAQIGQETAECHGPHQINLLDDLHVKTSNGYVCGSDSGVDNIREENSARFKIGFHNNIQVVFGATSGRNQTLFYDPTQIINQVFAAALSIGCCSDLNKIQLILNWTYEATLKAAFVKGKRRVFLTRMGGGVFGNPQNAIDEAIKRAVLDPDLANSGLEVILNNFVLGPDKGAIRNNLNELVKATGGTYTIY